MNSVIEETVEAEILSLRRRYRLRGVVYDPWQLIYLRQRLEKAGIQMLEFNQVTSNPTAMTNGLIDLVRTRRLMLYPDEALREAAMQTVIIESARGMRLAKTKSSHRIDPIVALAMGCVGALQRRGFSAIRSATFGGSPWEAIDELFGNRRSTPDDLPLGDIVSGVGLPPNHVAAEHFARIAAERFGKPADQAEHKVNFQVIGRTY
jgi:hypothetical protein